MIFTVPAVLPVLPVLFLGWRRYCQDAIIQFPAANNHAKIYISVVKYARYEGTMPMSKFAKAILLLSASALMLVGCGKSKLELREEALRNRVATTLNDPQSAQFRNIKLSADQKFLCGEINAKNRMGGYVGFRPFAVSDDFDYIADENLLGLTLLLKEPAKAPEDSLMTNIRKSGCFA